MKQCYSPGLDRDHTFYRYTDQIYKVVQWKRLRTGCALVRDPSSFEEYDHKLESSISRAKRVVLEYALCNPWDWFFTCTINRDKFDRSDLRTWHKVLTQWLRDQRKKFPDLKFLLLPEQHQDGSWHCHGFLYGLPSSELISFEDMHLAGYRSPKGRPLPSKLISSGYMNWPAYQSKFGYCSLGALESPVAAAFYITKYITKDISGLVSDVGFHLYWVSRGLNTAEKHLDYFGRNAFIDSLLVNDYDFCKTGFTSLRHGLDFSFGLDLDDSMVQPLVMEDPALVDPAVRYLEFEQLFLTDWG